MCDILTYKKSNFVVVVAGAAFVGCAMITAAGFPLFIFSHSRKKKRSTTAVWCVSNLIDNISGGCVERRRQKKEKYPPLLPFFDPFFLPSG